MAEKYVSTAKVIDGVLILSLPDAETPVVWQMELGQSKSSALEIRTVDGKFILTLKTPRQDVLDIAAYLNRDVAIKALMVVSQAMEKAQGQLKAAATHSYPVPALSYQPRLPSGASAFGFLKGCLSFLVKIAGGLILLAVILFIGSKIIGGGQSPSSGSASSGNGPVSADEFLEGR